MKRFVLVIDDNREIANNLLKMLGLLDYEVRVAYGPLTAMKSLATRLPDVILLDINMPGVNGTEVCRYIRRDVRLAKVPILAMSTETQEAMVARIRAAGANGFLAKPIGLEALEHALRELE